MSKPITEKLIARVENAIRYEETPESIRHFLVAEEGLSEYDAWLAFKAAETSLRMFQVEIACVD